MAVVGQTAEECVAVGRFSCRCIFFQSVVLPQGDGALHSLAEGCVAALGNYRGFLHETVVEFIRLPAFYLFARVEADVALGQAEIWVGRFGAFVGCVDCRLPAVVAFYRLFIYLCIEVKAALAAIVVAEASFAEKPCEYGNAVLALFQIVGNVYNVAVVVAGGGAALQTALEHRQPAVYPQPIFAVGGYSRQGLVGLSVENYLLAENLPRIFTVVAVGCAYPFAVVVCCLYADVERKQAKNKQ